MKKLISLFLLLTILSLPAAAAQELELETNKPADPSLAQGLNNNVVATVNGQKINSQQLAKQLNFNQLLKQVNQVDQNLAQILAGSEAGKEVLEELKVAKLDNLINSVLLKQQVEKEGIELSQSETDKIYQKQKEAIMKQNQMTEKDFANILKKQGYQDESEYKDKFANNPQLKINKLIEKKVVSKIEVSEKEIKKAYQKNKKAFSQSDQEPTYKKLKPRLKRMLKNQKKNQAIDKYLKDLRENAEINKNI